jgi:hypothetical protein
MGTSFVPLGTNGWAGWAQTNLVEIDMACPSTTFVPGSVATPIVDEPSLQARDAITNSLKN